MFRRRIFFYLLLVSCVCWGDEPFRGITHTVRDETTHVIKIKLREHGIRFHLTPHSGSREVTRQTTLDFLNHEHAQLAINGHFFMPFPSTDMNANLIGIAASDGDVYSQFEKPEQSYAIVANAPGINIDRKNHARLVHNNPREMKNLWTVVAGSAQIVTDGQKTIPVYMDGEHPDGLLTPGGTGESKAAVRPDGAGNAQYSNQNSWYEAKRPRTAIGLSRDNKILIIVITMNTTVGAAADALIAEGAYNGLNLDGGGSTSLVMEDPATHTGRLINESTDPNPGGRIVASSLAVFAQSKQAQSKQAKPKPSK